MAPTENGRWRQKRRTRKDLLQAAARLLKEGRKPTLEEVADEAEVSRATAYRYFPNVEALLVEAPLDIAVPDAAHLFEGDASTDPVRRLSRVDGAFEAMISKNESALRLMLANALQQSIDANVADATPVRQDRRTPLIEAALAPSAKDFRASDLRKLKAALALVVGTESMLVFKDVLRFDSRTAQQVKRWAIRALVEAARR